MLVMYNQTNQAGKGETILLQVMDVILHISCINGFLLWLSSCIFGPRCPHTTTFLCWCSSTCHDPKTQDSRITFTGKSGNSEEESHMSHSPNAPFKCHNFIGATLAGLPKICLFPLMPTGKFWRWYTSSKNVLCSKPDCPERW